MHSTLLVTALGGIALAHAALPVPGTTGALGPAAVIENNPIGVTYTAILPDKASTGIRGYVAGTTAANGKGVDFNINLFGFPSADLGPFSKRCLRYALRFLLLLRSAHAYLLRIESCLANINLL